MDLGADDSSARGRKPDAALGVPAGAPRWLADAGARPAPGAIVPGGTRRRLRLPALLASYIFTLTLFSQLGLGLDALHAGLVFTPTAVLFMTTAFVGHRLVARWGARPIVYGALLTASSLVAVTVLVAARGEATSAIALTLIAAAMGPATSDPAVPDRSRPRRRALWRAGSAAGADDRAAVRSVLGRGPDRDHLLRSRRDPGGPRRAGFGMVWATSVEAVLMVCVAVMVASGARNTVRTGEPR